LWRRVQVTTECRRIKAAEEVSVVPEGKGEIDRTIRAVLRDVLALSEERVAAFDAETPLFGALPELDSMAVAGVLTEIEDRLGIIIEDDEVDGEMLETFGALSEFATAKAIM
jgi:acyl carrier protein